MEIEMVTIDGLKQQYSVDGATKPEILERVIDEIFRANPGSPGNIIDKTLSKLLLEEPPEITWRQYRQAVAYAVRRHEELTKPRHY